MIGGSAICMTLSRRGLLTVRHGDRQRVRRYSTVLLFLMFGGLVCSIAFRGDEMYSAVFPAAVILLAQQLMSIRLREGPSRS